MLSLPQVVVERSVYIPKHPRLSTLILELTSVGDASAVSPADEWTLPALRELCCIVTSERHLRISTERFGKRITMLHVRTPDSMLWVRRRTWSAAAFPRLRELWLETNGLRYLPKYPKTPGEVPLGLCIARPLGNNHSEYMNDLMPMLNLPFWDIRHITIPALTFSSRHESLPSWRHRYLRVLASDFNAPNRPGINTGSQSWDISMLARFLAKIVNDDGEQLIPGEEGESRDDILAYVGLVAGAEVRFLCSTMFSPRTHSCGGYPLSFRSRNFSFLIKQDRVSTLSHKLNHTPHCYIPRPQCVRR